MLKLYHYTAILSSICVCCTKREPTAENSGLSITERVSQMVIYAYAVKAFSHSIIISSNGHSVKYSGDIM